jgi:hypothetical protein
MLSADEITGNFDIGCYAFLIERLRELRLQCFWKVSVLRRGAMLVMTHKTERESIFVKSPVEFAKMEKNIVDWASS